MRVVSIFLLTTLVASPALSADVVDQSEVASAAGYAFNWTGPEFGMTAGLDRLNAGGSQFISGDERFSGGRVGAFAGYQYQLDNQFVFGIEGDVSYTSNERDDFYNSVTFFQQKIRTDWSGSVRARVGYAFDKTQVFATGGWAATRAVFKEDSLAGWVEERENFSGFTVGAGVDYAFSDNVFARAEYRYNKFGEKTVSSGNTVDLDQHVLNIGLGVKF